MQNVNTPMSTDRPFSSMQWSVDKPVGNNGTAIYGVKNGGQKKKGGLLKYRIGKWYFLWKLGPKKSH